jgi:hypothetical protein
VFSQKLFKQICIERGLFCDSSVSILSGASLTTYLLCFGEFALHILFFLLLLHLSVSYMCKSNIYISVLFHLCISIYYAETVTVLKALAIVAVVVVVIVVAVVVVMLNKLNFGFIKLTVISTKQLSTTQR